MSNDQPPTVTTLEGVGVLLWAMQRQLDGQREVLEDQSERLKIMATHDDIKGIRTEIAQLVTRTEFDARLLALRDEVNRSKPSTLGRQIVAWAAGITVVLSCGALLWQIVVKLDRITSVTATQGATK